MSLINEILLTNLVIFRLQGSGVEPTDIRVRHKYTFKY
jgi:hypothetical protein